MSSVVANHITALERRLWNDETGEERRGVLAELAAAEKKYVEDLQSGLSIDEYAYVLKLLLACKAAGRIVQSYRRQPATYFEE